MSSKNVSPEARRLILIGFAGLIIAIVWKILFLDGLNRPGITLGVLFAGTTAGLLYTRARWMILVAAAVALFAVMGAFGDPVGQDGLGDPVDFPGSAAATLIQILGGATAGVTAIIAVVQSRRAQKAAQ